MYPLAQWRELVTLLAKSCEFGFHSEGFPGGASDKELPANAEDLRDMGSIPR